MITLETKKINLISQIITFNNEKIISELENFVKNISLQLYQSEVFKPIKKELIIDEMIIEQNFTGVNKQKMENIITDIDIQEPISELIAMT
jgi:hypothetical protein